jgi:hypothetical protein
VGLLTKIDTGVPVSGGGEKMYEVVWPRGKRATRDVHLAKRLDKLEGKTIGSLWNFAFRGDEIFPIINKELERRYPKTKFVSYEMFGSTHGGDEAQTIAALPEKLRQNKVDAIISGIGC